MKSIDIARIYIVRPSASRQRSQLHQCVVICSKIYFILLKYFIVLLSERARPQFCFHDQLVFLSHPSVVPKAGLFYMTTLFTKTTQLVLPVFRAPSPSEEVGGMNTKLFSELKIFHVWIDDKITEKELSSFLTAFL